MDNSFFCTRPWTSFQIDDHKGNVNPCCWSKINCGNVNEATIEEIWNGQSFRYMREQMLAGNLDHICRSDCPIRLGDIIETDAKPTSKSCLDNWLLKQEEITRRCIYIESMPTMMRIVPSVECNLTCGMCYQDRNDTVVLPLDIETQLQAYYPYLKELLILGGEPLLNRDCLRIIRDMDFEKYSDLHLALITNGTVITPKIMDILKNCRISWILVSVDAATEQTFKKVRGGKLSKVIDGIKKLEALRKAQNNQWILQIGFTLMRSNRHELCQFVDLANSLGVDFSFSPIIGDWHDENFVEGSEEMLELNTLLAQLKHKLTMHGCKTSKMKSLEVLSQETIIRSDPKLLSVDAIDIIQVS